MPYDLLCTLRLYTDRKYLKTHHTELDIADYEVFYNFKSGSYVMKIDVANSIDKDFRLSYRGDIGIQDDYDWMVLEKGNMQNRVAAFLNEDLSSRFLHLWKSKI